MNVFYTICFMLFIGLIVYIFVRGLVTFILYFRNKHDIAVADKIVKADILRNKVIINNNVSSAILNAKKSMKGYKK